jgi:hypothetical protein
MHLTQVTQSDQVIIFPPRRIIKFPSAVLLCLVILRFVQVKICINYNFEFAQLSITHATSQNFAESVYNLTSCVVSA